MAIRAENWTGAQFSALRIATGLAALYWSVAHWEWTPSIALPIAALMLAIGWQTRAAALAVLLLTTPLLGAAMPLFLAAPSGPYGSLIPDNYRIWRIPNLALWIARLATILLLVVAAPASYFPLGLFALLTLLAPGWIPGTTPEAVERLYYDGACGLCHGFIQFLLSEDPEGTRFRFAPLDSPSFREHVRVPVPDSVVVVTASAEVLTRSRAALHVLHRLGGYWRILALLATPIPAALLDSIYDVIASNRHRLFAAPEAVCPLMPKELRSRFDV